jgi:hypothetical protein
LFLFRERYRLTSQSGIFAEDGGLVPQFLGNPVRAYNANFSVNICLALFAAFAHKISAEAGSERRHSGRSCLHSVNWYLRFRAKSRNSSCVAAEIVVTSVTHPTAPSPNNRFFWLTVCLRIQNLGTVTQ